MSLSFHSQTVWKKQTITIMNNQKLEDRGTKPIDAWTFVLCAVDDNAFAVLPNKCNIEKC